MATEQAVSHDILDAALAGLEARKKMIEEHIVQVQALLGTAPKRRGRPPKNMASAPVSQTPPTAETRTLRKRRKMSPAAKKRMAEAMRKRWAVARKAGRTTLG
jgi:hypothetical protein